MKYVSIKENKILILFCIFFPRKFITVILIAEETFYLQCRQTNINIDTGYHGVFSYKQHKNIYV